MKGSQESLAEDDRGVKLPSLSAVLVFSQSHTSIILHKHFPSTQTLEFESPELASLPVGQEATLRFTFALKEWQFSCLIAGPTKLSSLQDGEASRIEDLLTALRKESHIQLCKTGQSEGTKRDPFLAALRFKQCTLPDFNVSDMQTCASFLGRTFSWPLLITGMTGGIENGQMINERLAAAAVAFQIPMGVGSQRIALENSGFSSAFQLKKKFPALCLIGNLGFAEILRAKNPLDLARKAVEMIDADALAIHLNVLQELIQSEGEHKVFNGLFDSLSSLSQNLGVPLILKEVGAGLDSATALKAVKSGVKILDVGGRGGTSWSYIEGQRATAGVRQRLGELFRDWGATTAEAILELRPVLHSTTLIATGGMRSGLDAARVLALGADMVGFGLPLFKAALAGEGDVLRELEFITKGLKTTMILANAQDVGSLRGKLLDPRDR